MRNQVSHHLSIHWKGYVIVPLAVIIISIVIGIVPVPVKCGVTPERYSTFSDVIDAECHDIMSSKFWDPNLRDYKGDPYGIGWQLKAPLQKLIDKLLSM